MRLSTETAFKLKVEFTHMPEKDAELGHVLLRGDFVETLHQEMVRVGLCAQDHGFRVNEVTEGKRWELEHSETLRFVLEPGVSDKGFIEDGSLPLTYGREAAGGFN